MRLRPPFWWTGASCGLNIIASQIDLHAKTGGVVPEVASRQHVTQINAVIAEALAEAGIGFGELECSRCR